MSEGARERERWGWKERITRKTENINGQIQSLHANENFQSSKLQWNLSTIDFLGIT